MSGCWRMSSYAATQWFREYLPGGGPQPPGNPHRGGSGAPPQGGGGSPPGGMAGGLPNPPLRRSQDPPSYFGSRDPLQRARRALPKSSASLLMGTSWRRDQAPLRGPPGEPDSVGTTSGADDPRQHVYTATRFGGFLHSAKNSVGDRDAVSLLRCVGNQHRLALDSPAYHGSDAASAQDKGAEFAD